MRSIENSVSVELAKAAKHKMEEDINFKKEVAAATAKLKRIVENKAAAEQKVADKKRDDRWALIKALADAKKPLVPKKPAAAAAAKKK
jgi:hypothetical protein